MEQLGDNHLVPWEDWGDIDDEDDVTELTEGVDAYSVRDFPGPPPYPLSLGDVVSGNGKSYRIEHKLGHGSFSTVWLAFEVESHTAVALKISRTLTTAGEVEYRAHQEIRKAIPDAIDHHLVTSSSAFSLPGRTASDSHFVMVLPVLGPNLSTHLTASRIWGRTVDASARMCIARDVLQSLAYLHTHNFIHRDVNGKNVIMGVIPNALDQGPTPEKRYCQIGRPKKWPLPDADFVWKAGELVAPVDWSSELISKNAFLGDFGLTIRAGSMLADKALPPHSFCAPELYHRNYGPSFGSDMWGYTCIFASVIIGFSIFGGSGALGTLDQMVGMLGPLPQQWENSYTWRKDDTHPGLYDPSRIPTDSLGAMIDRCREDLVGTRERDLILDVLEKGFRYEPSERLTSEQLLNDASFLELMSIHGVDL
ncbi:protein kinase [Diaporthe sp. PMI_573]|nr:protein kinase [Diaporthaceae sp. PMI_573]